MTELRDARLQRALRSAPDGDALPPPATRLAIRDAAHAAVRPASRGWFAWWPRAGQRMPWNAAFATVLLGVLVGVLWRGEEVPDAVTDASRADRAIPAPVAPAASPPPQAAPVPAPAPARPAPAPVARPAPRTAPAVNVPETQAMQDSAGVEAERRLAKSAAQDTARREAPAGLARERAAAEAARAADTVAAAAPAPQPPPVAATARPSAMAPEMAREMAPAPAAAAPAPAPRAARPGFSEGTVQLRASAAAPWSQLRMGFDGRTVVVDRSQAGRLPSLIDQVLAAPASQEPWDGAAALQLEWSAQGQRLGQLEATPRQARWTLPSGSVRVLQPDPALLQALREEALQRLR